ncbi:MULTISPECIES: hypothetical protein [Eubacterium]|jgi:hypothetical protein|uniref:Uncharacterized protein n=2 Tax=Eubacterium TaxID=1730 RepID=A0ABT2M2U9_9FIRM|nr:MULTISPECIES: hypothetical protein [unclassified Eubacterium (in: firmicutes)]MCT7399846.1 hypothetical protein [Eubacterium sp. LFL-14]MEE0294291.1 hypothetical protein [Eubacterium sp.]CDA30117.1 uncharacterized protein BN504_01618 [Eubacterium sp. CAG:156]
MIYNYIPVYIQQSSLSEGFFIKMDSSFSNKIDYVKEMYPKAFAKIQSTIEEECDKMDYVGSPMYDEYPDKTRLLGIRDRIFEIVHMENAACENDVCIIYPEDDWLKDTIMVLLLYEIQRRNQ